MSPHDAEVAKLADRLLALPDTAARLQTLRAEGFCTLSWLARLQNEARQRMRTAPPQTVELADLCAAAANALAEPIQQADAFYLRAQALAFLGRFQRALKLIDEAQALYQAQQEEVAATRTLLGRMHVLRALGCYDQALAAGMRAVQLFTDLGHPELAARAEENLGNICTDLDRYDEALAHYERAQTALAAAGVRDAQAQLDMNRAVVLAQLDRVDEALAAFQQAATVFAANGRDIDAARAQGNVGFVQVRRGEFGAALAALESARRRFERVQLPASATPVDIGQLNLETGHAYLALNLLLEAEAAYEAAYGVFKEAGLNYETGQAALHLGVTATRRGAYSLAAQHLAAAECAFRAESNAVWLAMVQLAQAALFRQMGEAAVAVDGATQAADVFQAHGLRVKEVQARLLLAELAEAAGDLVVAEQEASAADALAEAVNLPHIRYRCAHVLGRLDAAQGRLDRAERRYREAIAQVERMRASLLADEARTAFFSDKLEVYQDLVLLILRREDESSVAEAFALVEQAKSRTLIDLMQTTLEEKGWDVDDGEVSHRLCSLRAQLNWYYNKLLDQERNPDLGEGRGVQWAQLQQEVHQRERELAQLRLRLAAPHAPTLHWSPPPVTTVAAAQAVLQPDQRLLEYYIAGDELVAFVVGPKQMHVQRQSTTRQRLTDALEGLAFQLAKFDLGADRVASYMPFLHRSINAHLADLYDQLIGPLRERLDGRRLIVVPHGLLHRVPFHALLDERGYLLEAYEISYVPSSTVLRLCASRPGRSLQRALVVGVPDEGIPQVQIEVEAVSGIFPGA